MLVIRVLHNRPTQAYLFTYGWAWILLVVVCAHSQAQAQAHTYLHIGMACSCGRMLNIRADALNATFCVCVLMVGYFCLKHAEEVSHPSGRNAVIMVKYHSSLEDSMQGPQCHLCWRFLMLSAQVCVTNHLNTSSLVVKQDEL